jgi:hypothetical protein
MRKSGDVQGEVPSGKTKVVWREARVDAKVHQNEI